MSSFIIILKNVQKLDGVENSGTTTRSDKVADMIKEPPGTEQIPDK